MKLDIKPKSLVAN